MSWSIHQHKIHLWFAAASLATLALCLILLPPVTLPERTKENLFIVRLNGTEVGRLPSRESAEECLTEARRYIASGRDGLIYMRADLETEGSTVYYGRVDDREDVVRAMIKALDEYTQDPLTRCYTVRIHDYTVNLASHEDVREVLSAALREVDPEGRFELMLWQDAQREDQTLRARVTEELLEEAPQSETWQGTAGMEAMFDAALAENAPEPELDFADYPQGLVSMAFGENIEIAEAYMPANQISSVETAIAQVMAKKQEKVSYEVEPGDTLSEIAEAYDLRLADLFMMNPYISETDPIIRVGDILTVTVPQSVLTVRYVTQGYSEEPYDAPVEYVDNNDWYTTQTKLLQEGEPGFRKVIARTTYEGELQLDREIVKEEIVTAAVPRILERGTRRPPTYLWPVSGGFITSPFGGRSAPKAGASTNHHGVDIGIPSGTAVMASSGGVVSFAGWAGGYGYVVYLDHEDGRQTRYGHLSKILVSSGETVSQGERIALSGNTGNSTGPHLHFEIRIGGEAVDPQQYVTN